MGIRIVSLSITPKDVLELLMREIEGDVIHHGFYEINQDKSFGSIVFERFFTRENYQRMLVVHTENVKGITNGTIITSSNPEEWKFQLDWDTEDNFMNDVIELLDEFIIEEEEG